MDENNDHPRGALSLHYRSKVMTKLSRGLRKRATKSEEILWQALRRKQLGGLKFRRQHPVGASVLDFYCHELRLAVEIDGPIHTGQANKDRDRVRQEIIELHGIQFLRFTADEVETNLDAVLSTISKFAAVEPSSK